MAKDPKADPKSVTFLTPDDLVPITAQLADHERRLTALEAGGVAPPEPQPGTTLVIGTWYSEMSRFEQLVAAGFSHVHEWAYTDRNSLGLLDKAHDYGLKVFLELSWAMEGNTFHADRLSWTLLPEYIAHPALAGWLSYDEPDLRNTPTGEMEKIYNAIKAKDPHHPIKVTIRYPWHTTGLKYIPYADIIAVDPYIIPYGPAEQAGDETASSVAVCGGKPVYTDVQTFDWKGTFSPPPGRIPTIEEVEIMGTTSLDAQTAAHRGLYCYLEDELWNDPELRNGIAEAVDAWRASVGAPSVTTRMPTERKHYPPLPAHPAIDALKARMQAEKRGHYPRPGGGGRVR